MRKFLSLCLLSLACGAPDEPAPEPAEFGQVEQALSALDGYGVDAAQGRCWTDNHSFDWNGRCTMPGVKKVFVNVQLGGCSSLGATDALEGVKSGLNYTRGIANARGWTVLTSLSTLNPGSGPMMTVDLDCGVALPGQGASSPAATQVTSGPGSCSNTQDGELCRYSSAKIRIVPSRVSGKLGWPQATSSQRRIWIDNIAAHELGHVLGLGHDVCGSGEGEAQLMADAACQPADVRNGFRASLTQFEKDMLAAFSL